MFAEVFLKQVLPNITCLNQSAFEQCPSILFIIRMDWYSKKILEHCNVCRLAKSSWAQDKSNMCRVRFIKEFSNQKRLVNKCMVAIHNFIKDTVSDKKLV